MTDTNQNTNQQTTTQPEGNGTAGKMFTQDEVNNIVKERLARERAKGTADVDTTAAGTLDAEKAALEAERQKLTADRQTFECERYCKENNLDTALVELIGADEPDSFKEKAGKLRSIFGAASAAATGVTVSTGAPHGMPLSGTTTHDGTEFFKPSKI